MVNQDSERAGSSRVNRLKDGGVRVDVIFDKKIAKKMIFIQDTFGRNKKESIELSINFHYQKLIDLKIEELNNNIDISEKKILEIDKKIELINVNKKYSHSEDSYFKDLLLQKKQEINYIIRLKKFKDDLIDMD